MTHAAPVAEPSPELQSARTTLKRRRERGRYERSVLETILDEALICHFGFVADGQPYVIPTTYARVGTRLYLHGAAASRALRALAGGVPACVTVTLVDGLVLARSAFHHSMNYRSVVILGQATPVTDPDEKRTALCAIVEHVVPGRSPDVRPPSDVEMKQTMVLALPITEASAKVRTGPPLDDAEDMTRACWAGVIPLRVVPEDPIRDAALPGHIVPEPSVTAYRRPGWPSD